MCGRGRLINHLLSYVRKGGGNSDEIIDVKGLIEDSLLFLERQLQRKKIDVELKLIDNL